LILGNRTAVISTIKCVVDQRINRDLIAVDLRGDGVEEQAFLTGLPLLDSATIFALSESPKVILKYFAKNPIK
jgi:hypothetical protein